MASANPVTLDSLPLKRIQELDDSGTERLPPETTQNDTLLRQLGRIDFRELVSEGDDKKDGGAQVAPAWPFQEIAESLHESHGELSVTLDFIKSVEENQAVTVSSTVRPKLLPREAAVEVGLRTASKCKHFEEAAKTLKRSAKSLELQVEREAVFYGALMRLQRNWKVKRQRGVSAGPGGSAGFSIDLSFPPALDGSTVLPQRALALYTRPLDQESTGMLVARPPPGQPINSLCLHLRKATFGNVQSDNLRATECSDDMVEDDHLAPEVEREGDRGVVEGVDMGAKGAHSTLRRIQAAVFDEQVFDCVGREAISSSSTIDIVGMSDTSWRFRLGLAATLHLELSEKNGKTNVQGTADCGKGMSSVQLQRPVESYDGDGALETAFEICLKQVYHESYLGKQSETLPAGVGTRTHDSSGKLREQVSTTAAKDAGPEPNVLRKVAAAMRHRVCALQVLSLLEKQVHGVPHMQMLSHPTWHPRVSAWDLSLCTFASSSHKPLDESGGNIFECTVVLRDEALTIEGLNDSSGEGLSTSKYSCSVMELPSFLLFQVASQLVQWLHEEASGMGLDVERNHLGMTFFVPKYSSYVAILATLDHRQLCVNWELVAKSGEDREPDHKFLGAASAESLRTLIVHMSSFID